MSKVLTFYYEHSLGITIYSASAYSFIGIILSFNYCVMALTVPNDKLMMRTKLP